MDFLSTYFVGKVYWFLEFLIWSVVCLTIGSILLYLSGYRPRFNIFKNITVTVIAFCLLAIGAVLFYIGFIWLFVVEPIIAACLVMAIILMVIGFFYLDGRYNPKKLHTA